MSESEGNCRKMEGICRDTEELRLIRTVVQRDLLKAQRAKDRLQLLGFLLDAENRVLEGLAVGRRGCPGGQGGRSSGVGN